MVNQLQDSALPQQLAQCRQVIDCRVEIQDLDRLAGVVQSDLAVLPVGDRPVDWRQIAVDIRLEFDFGRIGDALPLVTGEVSTTLIAVCQRCLEACSLPLKTTLRYILVPAGTKAVEYEDYEVWELEQKSMRPIEIVEEALIMAMPFPALHESADDCGPVAQEFSPDASEIVRPFAGLKAQMDESK